MRVAIEEKWQKFWKEKGIFKFDINNTKNKLYVLNMFPYPSGNNLHMGHWYQYAIVDSWAKLKKMQGFNVFQPMGFDAFGLPAENHAIKSKEPPAAFTLGNINIMRKQLEKMGVSYDWDYEVITCNPDYYKWTQWLFLELYKNGLAYKKKAPVNWCPSCQTVLANEQVIDDGHCERCSSQVEKKDLAQWFFKITDFADDLLSGIHSLNWPQKTKIMQEHWIGKSVGTVIKFKVNEKITLEVFTTRPDTIFGVTYVVIAPEHHQVAELTTVKYKTEVEKYIQLSKNKTEIDRLAENITKTGIPTGSFAINPITNEKIPIYVADYVLANYGTGVVMAVPAHDERDYQFAKNYNLPIKQVITGDISSNAYTENGQMIDSGKYTGMFNQDMITAVTDDLTAAGLGYRKINYRLHDWLISRQRYWGAPIPIIHCEKCGEVPVPISDLPVLLPTDVDFLPTGESPLARSPSFVNTKCPKCNNPAKREVDTMDTFVCSSWYFLRYPDAKNSKEAFDVTITKQMLPVDRYVGGPEHACMHLLYARFITHVLKKLGYIDFSEPFPNLTHQGLILGPDNQKMSKSKGNTVSPDECVKEYGSDILRMYLMFGFSYEEGGPWNETGVVSMSRFLNRIEKIFNDQLPLFSISDNIKYVIYTKNDKDLLFVLHSSIKNITRDSEKFGFNTSIARLMELTNQLQEYTLASTNPILLKKVISTMITLLAPFAPHFAEEWWSKIGNKESIFHQKWPTFDEEYLKRDTTNMAVMVNGKLITEITVASSATNNQIKEIALATDRVQVKIGTQKIIKEIIIPKKLINFVLKN